MEGGGGLVLFQRKMTLLEDNHPGALYNYLISVQTGHRKNAGTTANASPTPPPPTPTPPGFLRPNRHVTAVPQVSLKLSGSEGESCVHTLTDPEKPVFERGAVDLFLLATPFPLGEVRNIRLQQDNTGGYPSWWDAESLFIVGIMYSHTRTLNFLPVLSQFW